MSPIKTLACLCLFALPALGNTSDEKQFQEYAEGALSVYAQIKEPSKEESERFYTYIKKRWEQSNCTSTTCTKDGMTAAKEYVYVWKKELDE